VPQTFTVFVKPMSVRIGENWPKCKGNYLFFSITEVKNLWCFYFSAQYAYIAWSVVYDKVKSKHALLAWKRRVSGNTVLCVGVSVSSLELADRSSRNLV
jgi:hypothetical protein